MSSRGKGRKDAMEETVRELEREIVGPRPWELRGEIKAGERPENSLLGLVADVERASKPAPVVSQEYTSSLEELIVKRIKDANFDDVALKKVHENNLVVDSDGGNENQLSQERDKKGLGDIYEEEFLSRSMKVKGTAAKDESEKLEIKELFGEICRQLDALSHFHFSPRPVVCEASIAGLSGTSLPSISLEDVGVSNESSASASAPEELYAKKRGRKAALLSESELTREDKNRLRQANKAARKRSEQQIEYDRNGNSTPESRSKNLQGTNGLPLDRRVVAGKIAEDGEQVSYGKSSEFFERLQRNAQDEISDKRKEIKQKKEKPLSSSKSLKL